MILYIYIKWIYLSFQRVYIHYIHNINIHTHAHTHIYIYAYYINHLLTKWDAYPSLVLRCPLRRVCPTVAYFPPNASVTDDAPAEWIAGRPWLAHRVPGSPVARRSRGGHGGHGVMLGQSM